MLRILLRKHAFPRPVGSIGKRADAHGPRGPEGPHMTSTMTRWEIGVASDGARTTKTPWQVVVTG